MANVGVFVDSIDTAETVNRLLTERTLLTLCKDDDL